MRVTGRTIWMLVAVGTLCVMVMLMSFVLLGTYECLEFEEYLTIEMVHGVSPSGSDRHVLELSV